MTRQPTQNEIATLQQVLDRGDNLRSRALFKRIEWSEDDPRHKEFYERLRLDPVVFWVGIAGAVTFLIFGYFAYH